MNAYLPLVVGFLGALLVGVGAWRSQTGAPVNAGVTAVGVVLLFVTTLVYLLALLGAVTLESP